MAHAARCATPSLGSREDSARKVRDDTPEDSLAVQQCKKDMFDLFGSPPTGMKFQVEVAGVYRRQ